MTELHLSDLTLRSLLLLLGEMPEREKRVYRAMRGEEFDAERAAAEMFLSPGVHYEIQRPDDEPVAAGGVVDRGYGVYRSWFAAPDWAWKAHGHEMSRLCQEAVTALLEGDLARRIETVTLASETRTRQWYEKIGLTYETTLRGCGSEDLVMYVALKKAGRADV